MKGRLIVLEGTDGSGKSTQFARLCQRAQEEGIPFQRLVFPQYQEESSALLPPPREYPAPRGHLLSALLRRLRGTT